MTKTHGVNMCTSRSDGGRATTTISYTGMSRLASRSVGLRNGFSASFSSSPITSGGEVVNWNRTGESVSAVGRADGISVSAGEIAVVGDVLFLGAGDGVGMAMGIFKGVGSSGTGIDMGGDAGADNDSGSSMMLTTGGASSSGSSSGCGSSGRDVL